MAAAEDSRCGVARGAANDRLLPCPGGASQGGASSRPALGPAAQRAVRAHRAGGQGASPLCTVGGEAVMPSVAMIHLQPQRLAAPFAHVRPGPAGPPGENGETRRAGEV